MTKEEAIAKIIKNLTPEMTESLTKYFTGGGWPRNYATAYPLLNKRINSRITKINREVGQKAWLSINDIFKEFGADFSKRSVDALLATPVAKRDKAALKQYLKSHENLDNLANDLPKLYTSLKGFSTDNGLFIKDWIGHLGFEYKEFMTREKLVQKLGTKLKKNGEPGELELDEETMKQLRVRATKDGLTMYDFLLENTDFFISKYQVKYADYKALTIKLLEEEFGRELDKRGLKPDIRGLSQRNRELYNRVVTVRMYTNPDEPIWYTVEKELGFNYSTGREGRVGEKFPEEELQELAAKKYKEKKILTGRENKRLNNLVQTKSVMLKTTTREVFKMMDIDAAGTRYGHKRMMRLYETITYQQHVKNMKKRDEKRARKKSSTQNLAIVVKAVADKKEKELL